MSRTAATTHLTNDVAIWSRYRHEIADNGKAADARLVLYAAPEVGGTFEYLYLETNGDPVLIGWLQDDEVWYDDENYNGSKHDPWIVEALSDPTLNGLIA